MIGICIVEISAIRRYVPDLLLSKRLILPHSPFEHIAAPKVRRASLAHAFVHPAVIRLIVAATTKVA